MTLKHLFLLTGLVVTLSLSAQERQFPQPAPMTPEMTQVWEPQPVRVTPGRMCSTVGTAPSDAIVLFDGTDLSAWVNMSDGQPAEWIIRDGLLFVNRETGDIQTRESFSSFQLHIEWMIPEDVQGEGQGRGNSGIFLQDLYEIQILDSYGCYTYIHGQAGGLYKQTPPLVNATRPPGQWNVYDIIWTAPTFRENGTFRTHPTITAFHNGVLIHYNQILYGTTEWIGLPRVVEHGPMPLRLQAHGGSRQPVAFRNIWIRPLN